MNKTEILKQLPPQVVRMYLAIRQQIILRRTNDRINKTI